MDKRCVNPFYHRLRFRTIDYIHIAFGTIFLAPIRLILCVLLFAMASILSRFFNYILDKLKLPKEEENKLRTLFKIPVKAIMRGMYFISGFYNLKIVDKGGPNDEKEARIIVIAPHTSPFDVLVGISLNCPSTVARHDAVDIPLFGNLLNLMDPVFVERDSQSSRNNVINSVLDKIKYLRVVFFPEATCGNRRALLQFKPGAFRPGLPVQPIAVKFDSFGGPDTLSWTWDGPPALYSIWLTLCRFSTGYELIKLPVYYPSEEEKRDPELYANNVSQLLSKELGLPNLSYTFDDVRYLQHRVFKSPVSLKFLKLCDKIMNQMKVTNNSKNNHSNGSPNGSAVNSMQHLPIKNKSQIFVEKVNDIIRDILEKIELNWSKQIQSIDDLISWINLDKYPELCKSTTIRELYNCLKISPEKLNTTHLAVVLQLCDMSEHNLWKRLKNSFNSLAKTRLNGESNTISKESFNTLLWLAFGVDTTEDNRLPIDYRITFDNFKLILLTNFMDCVQENGRELLTD